MNITDNFALDQVLYHWDTAASNTTLLEPYFLNIPSSDGQHILRVYANDSVGNWAFKVYVFTVGVISSSSSTTTSEPTTSLTPGFSMIEIAFVMLILSIGLSFYNTWRKKKI